MTGRRVLASLMGLLAGVALLWWWFSRYGEELTSWASLRPQWLLLALFLMVLSPVVQSVRTALLFECSVSRVARTVGVCHGLNALAPLMGDFFEILWLSKLSGLPVARAAERCIWRSVFTLGGTFVIIAISAGWPEVGLLIGIIVFGVARYRDWFVPRTLGDGGTWLGAPSAGLQLGLSLLQAAIEGVAFWLVAYGSGVQFGALEALGHRALVEWTTYLPIPLSGLGAHHVGITELGFIVGTSSSGLGVHAVVHHGLWLLSSVAVGLTAWMLFTAPGEEE